VLLCALWSGIQPSTAAGPAANVDAARLTRSDQDSANWLSYGRTYSEQRFSPLAKITADNAKRLGLAWFADLDTDRGQEATPLVIDGVLYVSTAWSMVKAYDAKTGKLLWSYDSHVPRRLGVNGCCDVVSRGVAAWKGKIYLAAFDGRLVALDAATGKPVWSVMTVDSNKPYTITQAPRVIKGRVLIGNSGAEYGTRGYISAYDAESGKLVWRFYTVPGDPSKPFENETMAMAAKTWSGEWWKSGGGGPVWDAISYDPELNLVYFGVGNGSEWAREYRSANKGDNLFLSSIVAVNADTGAYVWHYQVVPGEEWDYDAIAQLVLADLTIDGVRRKVLMQANKDGFFYILDRRTGKLISAKPYVAVNWASGIDLNTGRPIAHADIRYSETGKPVQMMPGPDGAHSWHPMAYNPQTGLAYIPTQEIPKRFTPIKDFKTEPIGWNLGVDVSGIPGAKAGYLLAWDPVKGREVWRARYRGPWNGGVVTTAGNIVAEGDAGGNFNVYRADTGEKLWSMFGQSAMMAGAVTYQVDGEQYISVLAGWGSAFSLQAGKAAAQSGNLRNLSRVLTFKLGGTAQLPPPPPAETVVFNPPPATADAATVATGAQLFGRFCSVCHGENAVGGGVVPDLRTAPYLPVEAWYKIVLDGVLETNGMAAFAPVLDRAKAAAIRAYVIHRANADEMLTAAGKRRKPDVNHGAVIAAQGTAAGAQACAQCHAFNGVSDATGAFPRLSGQSGDYLAKQLLDFASGVRASAIMTPIAKAMSSVDIADVAAYYAGVEAPFLPLKQPPPELVKRGEELAKIGSAARQIPACDACHGSEGVGEPPTIPYLGGQYAHYIVFALQMWQEGFRTNSPDAMALFAKRLDDQDMTAVAAYFQQVHPAFAEPGKSQQGR
jgi:alcohol dehydrogenase (cytochrome c)/quinohemoprotein ethanol dehydrogenase